MSLPKCAKPAAASRAVNGLRDSEFAGERLDPKHTETTPRQQASADSADLFAKPPGPFFGSWEVLSVDETGKRATARCVCGRIHVLGVEALELGITTSCGCRPPPLQNREAFRLEQSRQKRQRDLGGWKMEGER
jgi:hypothetical protein